MPNNYIVGMDAEPEDVIMKKITTAREEIQNISQEIFCANCKCKLDTCTVGIS